MSTCAKKHVLSGNKLVVAKYVGMASTDLEPFKFDVSAEIERALESVHLLVFLILFLSFPRITFYKPHFRRKRLRLLYL